MKILWVEDIPCGKEAVKAILEKDDPELDKALSYQDAILKTQNAIESYDVIFLDINLIGKTDQVDANLIGKTDQVDADSKIDNDYLAGVKEGDNLIGRAAQFNLESAKQFLEEAGFHLYIELLEKGYPKDRIAFISANTDTSKKFSEKFEAARMTATQSFSTDFLPNNTQDDPFNSDTLDELRDAKELNEWLQDRNTNYIKLRRGIIDACDALKADENIRNLNDNLGLSETNIKDKLDELRQMLPIRVPDIQAKERLLKRMVRAIVHDWESYDPSKSIKYKRPNGYGYILKTGRNWLTHDSAHNMKVDEKTVAFLFILHIRSVFKLNPRALEDFESKLLQLFTTSELLERMLKNNIKASYSKIWSGDHYSNLYFLNLCDAQHKLDEKKGENIKNHNYRSLLFQSFFHLRFPVRCSIRQVDKSDNFDSLQAYFNFVNKDENFISKINSNGFETELFKAFYSTAFPES